VHLTDIVQAYNFLRSSTNHITVLIEHQLTGTVFELSKATSVKGWERERELCRSPYRGESLEGSESLFLCCRRFLKHIVLLDESFNCIQRLLQSTNNMHVFCRSQIQQSLLTSYLCYCQQVT